MRRRYGSVLKGHRGGGASGKLEAPCQPRLQFPRLRQERSLTDKPLGLGPGVVLRHGLAGHGEVVSDASQALTELNSSENLSYVQHLGSPSSHGVVPPVKEEAIPERGKDGKERGVAPLRAKPSGPLWRKHLAYYRAKGDNRATMHGRRPVSTAGS